MSDFALDRLTHDIDLDGDSVFFTDDSIRQQLEIELLTQLGEWFLDRALGIPYHEEVLKKAIDPSVIDSVFKGAILSVAGVVELLEFQLELITVTRQLRLTFKARTIEGIINYSQIIPS